MRVEAPKMPPDALLLDRKESGLLHFVKYRGLGNDFIMVDNKDSLEPRVTSEQAVKLCDRNFGIGADGVIFAMTGINGSDCSMRIFNLDGSEPEVKVDMGQPTLTARDIPTKLPANKNGSVIQSELVVDGIPWNATCVSMGSPHCITIGTKAYKALDVDDLKLVVIGPKFKHHEMFPSQTNTEFVQVSSRSHLKIMYGSMVQEQL